MKRFFTPLLVIAALLFVVDSVAADEKPSCIDYTKGEFEAQNITSQEICQTACQTAEGFPVGRFNTEEDNPDYAFCYCIKENDYGLTTDTRDLCKDGALLTSGGSASALTFVTTATATLVVVLVSM